MKKKQFNKLINIGFLKKILHFIYWLIWSFLPSWGWYWNTPLSTIISPATLHTACPAFWAACCRSQCFSNPHSYDIHNDVLFLHEERLKLLEYSALKKGEWGGDLTLKISQSLSYRRKSRFVLPYSRHSIMDWNYRKADPDWFWLLERTS